MKLFLKVTFAVCSVMGLATGLFAQSPLGIKTCELPRDRRLGQFIVYVQGDPIPLGTRPNGKAAPILPAAQPVPQVSELRGKISYPVGAGLGIIMQEDKHGPIKEKLEALTALDPTDVRSLSIATEIDFECFKLIERFQNLRELSLVVDEWLERDSACATLEQLSKLRKLGLSLSHDCRFGSSRFCEAILKMKELRYLSIPCEKLADRDVVGLATHPSLTQIYLRSRSPVFGPSAMHALANVRGLRELALVCTNYISDNDVIRFAGIDTLEIFCIATNAPLTCQEQFKQLRPDCYFFVQEPSNEAQ